MGFFSLRSLALLGAMLFGALATTQPQLLPSQDPWYSPPPNFERHAPGDILRVRKAASNITLLVNNTAGAYQILFRSANGRHQPTVGVTTVFLPPKAKQAGRDTRALVSYQIPYNSPDVDQRPSYGLSTAYGEPIMANVRAGLGRGWAVSVPDFEGPQAAFSAGIQAGHAVLDSVRAVLSWDKFGSRNDKTRSALWGYSGGAFASDWAAELQAEYAPELRFAGTAIGGVTVNFTEIIFDANASPTAAILPYVLLGVTAEYPEARAYLLGQLHEEGAYNKSTFLAALHTTPTEAWALYSGNDVFKYFASGVGILKAPELVRVLGNNWFLGYNGIPQMPVFVYNSIEDERLRIATVDENVDRICRVGANVLYQRNTVGTHDGEYYSGSVRALEWLGKVLDGKQPEPTVGCKVETLTAPA